ncbi:MAG TPA: hypothetical protein VI749_02035 [Candidatus Omnitrophota bacterium]|nr:hypothetical protein [Candidatus Omnitrophota bacterium]
MAENYFNNVIFFFSRHFELLLALNLAGLFYYILLLIALKSTDRSFWAFINKMLEKALFSLVFAVQMVLIALMGYLYWYNYYRPLDYLLIPGDVIPHTFWVESKQPIYFIDGNDLLSTQANGEERYYIFEGDYPIREYHFSADGRYMVIVTIKDLYLYDRNAKKAEWIDGIELGETGQLKGVVSGVRWAKDSRKFCYEISRWSAYASSDQVYIYFIDEKAKRSIQSPARRISHLYWDKQSENLYYLKHETEDESSINQVKVIRIPMDSLTPELVTEISYQEASVPIYNLNLRDIDLFLDGDYLSFGALAQRSQLVSEKGKWVGIDEEDNFYFINEKWFRQRLFKVRRKPIKQEGDLKRHQYQGDLTIQNIRWLPGGRHVVMEHTDLGIFILDPFKNKMGQLMEKRGHSFGWFIDIEKHSPSKEWTQPSEPKKQTKRRLFFVPQ